MGGRARPAGESGGRPVKGRRRGKGRAWTRLVTGSSKPCGCATGVSRSSRGISLGQLGLPTPSQDVVALVQPFAATGEAVLRLEVRDGRASVTVREPPPLAPPTLITASEPHQSYPHKTTERDCFTDAGREAEVAEADDALLLTPEGWVAEGTVWTVFWWDGDALRTPALDLGILPGVGRTRVLELVTRAEQGG